MFWVGPNVAAFIGCGLYKFLFSEPEDEKNKRESIFLDDIASQTADKV